ncbi:MAG: hypothetical protein ACLRSW_00175 [Christensenellaceae bacterium]
MASDSKQRESAYLATGCNSFNGSRTKPAYGLLVYGRRNGVLRTYIRWNIAKMFTGIFAHREQ